MKKPKLLILGDSISLGVTEVYRGEVLSRVPVAYPDLLRQAMPGWEVVVDAAVNRTSAQALPLLAPLLEQHRPDVVFLQLGGNDGDLDWRRLIMTGGKDTRSITPPEKLEANLQKMVGQARAAGATPLLGDFPKCDIALRGTWVSARVGTDVSGFLQLGGGQSEADARAELYLSVVEGVADRNDAQVVRWAEEIAKLPRARAYGPDHLHPGADAQPVIADTVAREVLALSGRARAVERGAALSA